MVGEEKRLRCARVGQQDINFKLNLNLKVRMDGEEKRLRCARVGQQDLSLNLN